MYIFKYTSGGSVLATADRSPTLFLRDCYTVISGDVPGGGSITKTARCPPFNTHTSGRTVYLSIFFSVCCSYFSTDLCYDWSPWHRHNFSSHDKRVRQLQRDRETTRLRDTQQTTLSLLPEIKTCFQFPNRALYMYRYVSLHVVASTSEIGWTVVFAYLGSSRVCTWGPLRCTYTRCRLFVSVGFGVFSSALSCFIFCFVSFVKTSRLDSISLLFLVLR